MRSRIVLTTALVLVCAGCGGEDASRTTVVAAFYPLAYAAERIAGGEVEVRNLTPAGAEPHDLELSARDVERVRDADVVLYLRGFMPALDDALVAHDHAIDLLGGRESDPHVWLDPLRYARIAERIGVALDRREAAQTLVGELRGLDRELRRGLMRCETRSLVTGHAAFGYLARRYGLEQVALTGPAPETEPSARALERLVEEVERTGATTVFFEPLVSPRLPETVAREAGVETAVLDPLEGLAAEDLDRGANYFSVMRENLAALRKALRCR